MRIAFFGGSFDPPHCGHIAIAHAAIERLRLDQVWMAPAGVQPLKRGGAATQFAERLAMARLACAGQPRMAATAVDAPREDGRPNYTYDTLREIRKALLPEDELFLLMGADAFELLRKWHRAGELPGICTMIVAGRPGASLESICAVLPEEVVCSERGTTPQLVEYALRAGAAEIGRLYMLPDLQYEVSATAARASLGAGAKAAEGVDERVAAYAREHGLYR